MPNPIGLQNISELIASPATGVNAPAAPAAAAEGGEFKDALMHSLEEVSRLQTEAAEGVERLALGETNNVAEVFSAVQKADVAFSMLMEMRNKLVDAYREIQQMRV